MIPDTDDSILEIIDTPRSHPFAARNIEIYSDHHSEIGLSGARISQRLVALAEHDVVEEVENGYYRITERGRRYLQGERLVNLTETGNTYRGEYGSGPNEYVLYKNGEEWEPENVSLHQVSWGSEGGDTGPAMVIEAILQDVTDEEGFAPGFLQNVARRFGLFDESSWVIEQEDVIEYLKNPPPSRDG
jgi:DNA-binding PadR family transcriptional regulator